MLDYVYGHDALIAQWVAERIPHVGSQGFGRCFAFGIVEQDELIAGLVYNNYAPEAGVIEMSGAALPGRNWLTRETIRKMFEYPFIGAGCQMLVNRVPADDERQLRQLAALNYSFIKVPRLLGPTRDVVLCLLTFEDWQASKFTKRFGQLPEPLERAA